MGGRIIGEVYFLLCYIYIYFIIIIIKHRKVIGFSLKEEEESDHVY